jgi:hypothetical protein
MHRADNLIAICEPIVWTMWGPQHFRTPQASTACYGDSFTLVYFIGGWVGPRAGMDNILFNSFISNQNYLDSIS